MYKALYGSGGTFTDVTEKLPFSLQGNYNSVFGDPCPGIPKELRISKDDVEVKIKEDIPFTLASEEKEGLEELYVVYACNTHDANLVLNQMSYFTAGDLPSYAKFYVEMYEDSNIKGIIEFLIPGAIIKERKENISFHSLDLLHDLKKGYSFYCLAEDLTRKTIEKSLFSSLLEEWRYCVKILDMFPSINKVGWRGSNEGWIWHNAYWVRGSYVTQCEKPLVTNHKPYYEYWLARRLRSEREVEEILPLDNTNYLLTGTDVFSTCKDKENMGSGYYN